MKFDVIKYINSPRWKNNKTSLFGIKKLLAALGNPQKNLKFVHVAGTNGKGSTCAFLSQILIKSDYKVGQFTSPYIFDFTERIQINNNKISIDDLLECTLLVKKEEDKFNGTIKLTEFDIITAIAFLYFERQKCDIVVCEVGLGGRLDSTNVISQNEVLACVITSIGLDHTQILGNTLEEIAAEKAGIIKKGVPVFCSEQAPCVNKILKSIANKNSCKLFFVNNKNIKIENVNLDTKDIYRTFSVENKNYKTQLIANYQPLNAALAIECSKYLKQILNKISDFSIYEGIKNTLWPARFQIIEKNPYVVVDGAHNAQGVKALIKSLTDVFGVQKITFIMGVVEDKNYIEMCKIVSPYAKFVYTVSPPSIRKLDARKLSKIFKAEGVNSQPIDASVALNSAKNKTDKNGVICIFGSLYLAASFIS